jgi:aminopeptidase YwaD
VRSTFLLRAALIACLGSAAAHSPPLLAPNEVAALANELSGETAKRNLEGIARYHRQRGSQGFHSAAELVAERARAYGLSEVQILQFPTDGRRFYGTQLSRQAWDAEQGDLTEVGNGAERTLASYEAQPVALAEDSESTDVTAELVDVGQGTQDSDYSGKDVRGRLVLASAQPGEVQEAAIGKFKAAGIVSYAQNQRTAWWGEDENLVRWGHLDSFSANPTFAFMVSLKTARALQERLKHGDTIKLHARVKAGQHPGSYEVVTGVIEGADPQLRQQEIAFSCHLDHQRPGANDNASGCVTILEVARTLQKLITEGKLARPARTIRFIWPPEIEGTTTLLNARPELARRIRAAIHMDMVGGGAVTKAIFHVTRGPMSRPSFVHDIAWAFADWVNEESYELAATGQADWPLAAPEGGKEPLQAVYAAFTMGSDHDVYQDSSFGIPCIYLNDWPDRYIHTNFDTPANIDPTKLRRAAFIGAASGYFLASFSSHDVAPARAAVARGKLSRTILAMSRHTPAGPRDEYEQAVAASIETFGSASQATGDHGKRAHAQEQSRGDAATVYRRLPEPKGPLTVFGYDYFASHGKAAGIATPRLLSYQGEWGSGEEYAYEALNFADGTRTAQQIDAELSAEYGPIPTDLVVEYLQALRKIGVVQ